MYLAIIILPLLGSIISGFFGRKVGVQGSQLITCTSIIIITLLSWFAFWEVGMNNIPVSIKLFRWLDSESWDIIWSFNFDSLTVSMLIPVLVVSCLVHVYSIGYMSHDPHNQRFFSYLSLFTFMMIILVTSNNFLLMFVGWEGVGVCSYLLVSFWFTRIAANQSSISAFLTNRVGDCFLTIGMFAILWSFGNIDYSTVFSIAPFVNSNVITLIGICLLIGAMAKSSQVGLHVWLPMAMEGPTPVSALIHAATMVTAGVYLLMRSSPLIEYSNTVLLLCLWIGAITTVFSSLIGLFQQDIKKIIAYSTMSQLGMMVIAVGLSSYNIALFHLVNHAFYKGLLFLGAGAVIHAVGDNQDLRRYGGLKSFLPLTYSVMLIASLSLVAFPFMTGFYSKDFILESAYGQFHLSSIVVYFISTIAAIFTTLYSIKVLYLTFLSNPNGPLIYYKNAHEGDIYMSLPLIILAIFSIFFGYITKDIFIGLGSNFFSDNSIFFHPSHEIMLNTEFAVPTAFKILPLIMTVLFSFISISLSEYVPKSLSYFKFSRNRIGYNLFGFFNQRFLIELFYNNYITNTVLKLGGQTTKVIDKGSIELIGPFGLEKGLKKLSKKISLLNTGVITSYALYILIGLTFYILMPYFYQTDNNIILIMILALLANTKDNNMINTKNDKLLKISANTKLKPILKTPIESNMQINVFFSALALSMFISLILTINFKLPLIFFLSMFNFYYMYPFVIGISSVLAYAIKQFYQEKDVSLMKMLIVFCFSATLSFLVMYIHNYLMSQLVLSTVIISTLLIPIKDLIVEHSTLNLAADNASSNIGSSNINNPTSHRPNNPIASGSGTSSTNNPAPTRSNSTSSSGSSSESTNVNVDIGPSNNAPNVNSTPAVGGNLTNSQFFASQETRDQNSISNTRPGSSYSSSLASYSTDINWTITDLAAKNGIFKRLLNVAVSSQIPTDIAAANVAKDEIKIVKKRVDHLLFMRDVLADHAYAVDPTKWYYLFKVRDGATTKTLSASQKLIDDNE